MYAIRAIKPRPRHFSCCYACCLLGLSKRPNVCVGDVVNHGQTDGSSRIDNVAQSPAAPHEAVKALGNGLSEVKLPIFLISTPTLDASFLIPHLETLLMRVT